MFRDTITQTAFTGHEANLTFSNIPSTSWQNDVTMVSSLRALVGSRIPQDEKIVVRHSRSHFGTHEINKYAPSTIFEAMFYDIRELKNGCGIIEIHDLQGSKENNEAMMKFSEDSLSQTLNGYHKFSKVQVFYHKSFNVTCFINPERKNVIILVDVLDLKKYHYLQVSIPAFLPWYFSAEDGVSEEEMELVYSLRESTADKYKECIGRMAEKYDFRSAFIKRMLGGFETRSAQKQLESAISEISDMRQNVDYHMQEASRVIQDIDRKNIWIMGLRQKIDNGSVESELMEYFLCNKSVILSEVTSTRITFVAKGYIQYFNVEFAESAIQNNRSYVYRYRGDFSADDVKLLLSEIFNENPRLKIRVCAVYNVDVRGSVESIRHYSYPDEVSGYMPNPHLDRYNCLGSYSTAIIQLLADHNPIGAIEQCIASAQSLNWSDSTVMEAFIEDLFIARRYVKFIEMPDGTLANTEEAIAWLKNENAEKESTVNEEERAEENE